MNHSALDGTPSGRLGATVYGDTETGPVRVWTARPAVAVTPETEFPTMAAVATASRLGVLPVVAPDGELLGVVSVSDLVAAYRSEPDGPGDDGPEDDGPATLRARDLMTSPAVTVGVGDSAAAALAAATGAGVHHLPVVDEEGRLFGILSPHGLLEALRAEDEAVRTEVLALALTPGSGVVPASLHVTCERGRVTLRGRLRTRRDAAALCLAVAEVDGLRGLTDRLSWDIDG